MNLKLAGALVIFALVCFAVPDTEYHTIDSIIDGLGDASLIAVIIAIAVDKYVKRRFVEDVVKDITPYLVAPHLPDELRREVNDIGKFILYRRNAQLSYVIEPQDRSFGRVVILKSTIEFELVNPSDKDQEFNHSLSVQIPPDGNSTVGIITYVSGENTYDEHGRPSNYEYRNEEIEMAENETHSHRQWSKKTYIKANSCSSFVGMTIQELPIEHEENFIGIYPTVGISVRVTCPSQLRPIVSFASPHRNKVRKVPTDNPTVWYLDAAMLAFQPVILEWRKKPV